MNNKQRRCHYLACSIATLACLAGATTLAFAQANAKPAIQKWRPKDGHYIMADRNFTGSCEDTPQYLFELSKKSVVGHEAFECEVTRLTDKAPGMLRLDMICDDFDLAQVTDKAAEMRSKEVMTLRKIDEKSFFVRITNKGKFSSREWRVNYCPKAPEPRHVQSGARDPAESRRRAVKDWVKFAAWLPRDGVYANPGTDFNDHCKAGDAVLSLSEISLSIAASHCEVSNIRDGAKNSISLDVICDQKPGSTGLVTRSVGDEIVFAPPGSEKMVIAKIDDQTISLQKSQNGEFSEPARQLAYCPDAVQRSYAESKKAK